MYGSIFNPGPMQGYGSPQNFGAYGVDPSQAGWNLNAAYLTPSNMAGYRPAYAGDQNFPMPYMGGARGAYTAVPTPFQPDTPFYINPLQYREHGFNSLANAGSDATVTALQFIGSTAVGLAVSSALTAKSLSMPVNDTWSGIRRAVGASRYGSMFEAMGGGIGERLGGVAGGLGGGIVSKATKLGSFGGGYAAGSWAGAGIGGAVGAGAGWAFGNIALPMIIADAVDKTVFSTYTGMRRVQDAVSESYRGYAGIGTQTSPLSVNRNFSRQVGYELTSEFSRDLAFKPGAGADIFQYAQQAGLYSNTQINPQQIREKTRQIAQQMKMVMEVFNEPSMQDAIQMVSRLSLVGGASGSALGGVGAAYRVSQAMTGTGTQKLFNTIGQQGQMMYGGSGLLPYLGQLSSLSAYNSVDFAFRNGLVSNQALAMMGGSEGATQSIVKIQSSMAQTQYNRMKAMLQEFYGGGKGGINATLGEYGQVVAGNPLIAAGQMAMFGDRAVSAQLSKNPLAMYQQMIESIGTLPGSRDENGKVRFEAVAGFMANQGYSSADINAMATQIRSLQDPRYAARMGISLSGANVEAMASSLEREGLGYQGPLHLEHVIKKAAANVQDSSTYSWNAITSVGGRLIDPVKQFFMPSTIERRDQRVTGFDELSLAGNAASSAFYAEMNSGVLSGVPGLNYLGGAAAGIVNAGASLLFDTDIGSQRSNLRNISAQINASPETKKQAEALVRKLHSGEKLSYKERRLASKLTGISDSTIALSTLSQSIKQTELEAKNAANLSKMSKEDLAKKGMSEFNEFLDASGKKYRGLSLNADQYSQLMKLTGKYAAETDEDKKAAMIEENGTLIASMYGKKSLDELSDAQITDAMTASAAVAATSQSSHALMYDSLEEGKSRASRVASLAPNQNLFDFAMDSDTASLEALNKVKAGIDTSVAFDSSKAQAEEFAPIPEYGDFASQVGSAGENMLRASKIMLEASRTGGGYSSGGYRTQTALPTGGAD